MSADTQSEPENTAKSAIIFSEPIDVATIAKSWELPDVCCTLISQVPDKPGVGGNFTRSTLFKSSLTPPAALYPLEKTLPLYVEPSGAITVKSRSFTNLLDDCEALDEPAVSVHAIVISTP